MCIFCEIINNEIPSKKVYEDESVIAILDINPVSDGHVLVIPKNHSKDLEDINSKDLQQINSVIKKLVKTIKSRLNCSGIHVITNIGSTQEIPHTHYHIIPIYDKSIISFDSSSTKDLETILKTIQE